MSFESDSDLESIPTISDFKQYVWKNSQTRRVDNYNENKNTRKLFGKNEEYIEGKWQNNQLIDMHSFQFINPYDNKKVYIRKQSIGYLFTFDEEDFITRAHFDKLEELDFSKPFTDIKRNFLQKLTVTEIIKDKLLTDRNIAYERFQQLLKCINNRTADNLEYAEDLFQLSLKLNEWKKVSNVLILSNIDKNKYISPGFKNASRQLLNKEQNLNMRKKCLIGCDHLYTKDLLKELQQICKDGVVNHRNSLYDTFSSSVFITTSPLIADLNSLNDNLILYIGNTDMKSFADIFNMTSEKSFLEFAFNLWNNLLKKIEDIRQHDLQVGSSFSLRSSTTAQELSLRNFAPLTHPIYFYLCKSFLELIAEISGKTNTSINDLFKNKQGTWMKAKTINWSSPTPLDRSLERQYHFIFKLMQHFEPGSNFNKKRFEYEFKFLQNVKNISLKEYFKSFFVSTKVSDTSEQCLIWMYILDNAIAKLFHKKSELLVSFTPLLEGYIDFIEKTEDHYYELFRVVTHNTVRFIAQTGSYILDTDLNSTIDQDILKKQIKFINKIIRGNQFVSNDFRDLIDVYNEYWINRNLIIDKMPSKFSYAEFKSDMREIHRKLLNIVNTVLNIDTESHGLIEYFRSFNEFLEDLNSIEFNWFIKEFNGLNKEDVQLINTNKKSYKVSDPERFINKYSYNIPNHYLIEIIKDLLSIVSDLCKNKKWRCSDNEHLSAISELLSAIRKSFLYLKEQPDYVSFDTFKKESTEPFVCTINNTCSYEDFKKRIGTIGESFWYLRKQDEIDIKKALHLYKEINIGVNTEVLESCYDKYLKKFDFYIKKTIDKNYDNKIRFIVEEIKKQSKPIVINKWKQEFKIQIVPELLAGLAAVWSVQVSKDIVNIGKSFKPHCIQILCIFKLLSVDENFVGVKKHLAQVLTGQGKSLVLGLLSSLLALIGSKVQIVCYSKYLATRDEQDFTDFFQNFDINDEITYGTFENMANKILNPVVNGKKQFIRDLTKNRILNHDKDQTGQINEENVDNTTLLIDEVDVFFSDQFYGNAYAACTIIKMPALASIQQKIWEIVKGNDYGKNNVLEKVNDFVKGEVRKRNEIFNELNKFRFKPGKYYLLKNEDKGISEKEYTNQSFYEHHLDKMIDNAMLVAKGSDINWYINLFKINNDGIISYRTDTGYYRANTYVTYYNVFNYFRLKQTNFDHKDYQNYGYFNVPCGYISYAKLPSKYPLILGVSGTLTTLHDHEKKAIKEFYNINNISSMPSFFGYSNLKFNRITDFVSQDSEEEWLNKIFNHTNSRINSGQSVLIFFENDFKIDRFKNEFSSKFSRMHILIENTEKSTKEKYVNEAGIPKTVTLATRSMGRGVDYKSSIAVEKNGGVHVIQTFFSLDIKEETQIKGRTARKDNKGSYELILCKEHLIKDLFLKEGEITVNYENLNKARKALVEIKGEHMEELIMEKENKHQITMNYFESFFKKD